MNDKREMNEARFRALLDLHGGDLERWPAADAAAAATLLERLPALRRELERARQLDGWLTGLAAHQAPAGLAERIGALVARPDPFEQLWQWLTARFWRPVLATALPVVFGFAIGLGLPDQMDVELTEQVTTLAFNDIYEELDDVQ